MFIYAISDRDFLLLCGLLRGRSLSLYTASFSIWRTIRVEAASNYFFI